MKEEKYFDLYDLAPVGYFMVSEQGLILEANLTGAALLGVERSDLIKQPLTRFIASEDQDIYYLYRKQLFETQAQVCEMRMVRKNGSQFHARIEAIVMQDTKSDAPLCLAVVSDVTERKRMEEALRASEAKYRELVQNANSIILRVDIQGRITFFNEFAQSFFGYAEDEILGRNAVGTIVPERETSGRDLVAMIQDIAQYPERYINNENENIRRNGERVWIVWTNKAILDDEGRVNEILCIGNNITERKRADNLIRAQRDLVLALSAAPGLDEGLRLCVEAALHVSGMDCGGVYLVKETSGALDLVFHKGLPPDFIRSASRFDVDSANVQLVMAGKPVYAEHLELGVPLDETRRREGLRAIAVLPIHHEGRVIGCLNIASHTLDEVPVFARDALETIAAQIGSSIARLRAEEALRESEKKHRTTLENIEEGYYEVDVAGNLVFFNNSLCRILGYSKDELVSLNNREYMDDETAKAVYQVFNEVYRTGEPAKALGWELIRKDGTRRFIEASVSLMNDSTGEPIGFRGVARDITERKRAEEQLKISLKEKEMLLKEIHHRVKNNLQVVSSLLNLQANYVEDEQVVEMLQESRNRIRSMALVHEKLYRSQDLARVNLAEYIHNLAAQLFHSYKVRGRGITLKTEIADVALSIDTAIPCGLIVNELLSNALKHAFPKGQEGEICVGLSSDQAKFTLTVGDNGVGFPSDLDFQNTESLGLQLVATLVEQLDGSIELDRSSGTTFKVQFQ